jgi:hypothetical protein
MDGACHDILGKDMTIRTDVGIYNAEEGYQDARGGDMMKAVKGYLAKY